MQEAFSAENEKAVLLTCSEKGREQLLLGFGASSCPLFFQIWSTKQGNLGID